MTATSATTTSPCGVGTPPRYGNMRLHVPSDVNGRAGQATLLFTAMSTDVLALPGDIVSAFDARA
jgi:hypothetical protein